MEVHVPEDELEEEFIRPAAGPGGQHVNKTSNGVRLVFHYLASSWLPADAKERLARLAGSAVSGGDIVITAKESRSLRRNRDTARLRLDALVNAALEVPAKRKKTKPTRASKERRLASKAHCSAVKKDRRKPAEE